MAANESLPPVLAPGPRLLLKRKFLGASPGEDVEEDIVVLPGSDATTVRGLIDHVQDR